MKYFLIIFFFFSYFNFYAQDYNGIDNYLINKGIIDKESEQIIFLLSASDCDKCVSDHNQHLKKIVEAGIDNKVIVVTNNKQFAKETLKVYNNFNYKLIYDKEIFSNKFLKEKSLFYIRTKDGDKYSEKNEISNFLIGKKNAIEIQSYIKKNDSLFIKNKINATILKNNNLLIFDKKTNNGILALIGKKNNIETTLKYEFKVNAKDNGRLFKLPNFNPSEEYFLVNYEDNSRILKENNLGFVKVYSFFSQGNHLYSTFQISRLYVNKHDSNDYRLVTDYFIGLKNLTESSINPETIDLSTFDEFFYINTLDFKDEKYNIGVWYTDTPKIIGDRKLLMKISKFNKENNENEYAGAVELELVKNYDKPKVLNLNKNYNSIGNTFDILNIQEKKYIVEKELTDEENNIGNIIMIELPKSTLN